ncbi:hypothetical protein D3C80_1656830 [compost metagenome]
MRQVAVEVRRGAAGRGRQQQHADRQRGLQGKAEGDEETGQRQQDDLADQADQHRLGIAHDTGEVRHCEGKPQPEHDDAEGDGEKQGQQGIGGHCSSSPGSSMARLNILGQGWGGGQ